MDAVCQRDLKEDTFVWWGARRGEEGSRVEWSGVEGRAEEEEQDLLGVIIEPTLPSWYFIY